MKILVTGATGFLGKYLVRSLVEEGGHTITLMGTSLERLESCYGNQASLKLVETDYSLPQLEEQMEAYDAVIHLAAKRISTHQLVSEYADNIRITENLLVMCDQLGVGRMVMAGTQSVYRNGVNIPPFKEEDAYRFSPGKGYGYAMAKYLCEELAHMYRTPVVSLRLGQLLGWGEMEGFMFTTQLRRVRAHEPIVLWGEGGGGRDYLYCKDAVRAFRMVMQPEVPAGVYNVSMGRPISFREFAETLVAIFGDAQSKIVYDTEKMEDRTVRMMDLSHTKKDLGWEPAYTLHSAFEDMKQEDTV